VLNIGAFSEYVNVKCTGAVKIDDRAPLDKVCLLGCGILAGYGAVDERLKLSQGDTIAVFGLGAVGLAACQAAKDRGASRIIGVDLKQERLQ